MGETAMNYFRAVVDLERKDGPSRKELLEDTSLAVPFVASTEGVKADGLDLKMEDWDLRRFRNYGPILWLHSYWKPPIGTGRAKADDKLFIDVNFDEDDIFAMEIRGKAIKGMMAGSVGWTTVQQGKSGEKFKNELIEFSMTPVGLDPDALPNIDRQLSDLLAEKNGQEMVEAIQALREEIKEGMEAVLAAFMKADADVGEEEDEREGLEVETEEEDPENREEDPEGGREDPAVTETVHFFWDGQEMAGTVHVEDEAGERLVQALHGASWVTDEDKNVLRDLPASELLARAGAALSKANREDLQAALDLITAVIERATPDKKDDVMLKLEDDDGRTTEPVEVVDDEIGETDETRDENEGLDSDLVADIEALLA